MVIDIPLYFVKQQVFIYCTNNILDCFVELAKKNINLEVNIFQNKIWIRLHDKNLLDINIKSKLDEKKIIDSCNYIIATINLNKFIIQELKINNIYIALCTQKSNAMLFYYSGIPYASILE